MNYYTYILDEDSPTNARPNTTKHRPKLQNQNSRTGSGGSSRPHTGYGKTRTTDGMSNGGGKISTLMSDSIIQCHLKQ